MIEKENLKCPSYVCKPGAELYGVVNAQGKVDFLKETFEINLPFIKEAYKGKDPENRFRFAGNCAKSGCKQWNSDVSKCRLIDKVIDLIAKPDIQELQYCPIRSKCRWYAQEESLACAQCNEVLRNMEGNII